MSGQLHALLPHNRKVSRPYWDSNQNSTDVKPTAWSLYQLHIKKAQCVSHKCHTILTGRWCDTVVLNEHSSADNINSDAKDSFCDKSEAVLNQFPKYRMQVFFRFR